MECKDVANLHHCWRISLLLHRNYIAAPGGTYSETRRHTALMQQTQTQRDADAASADAERRRRRQTQRVRDPRGLMFICATQPRGTKATQTRLWSAERKRARADISGSPLLFCFCRAAGEGVAALYWRPAQRKRSMITDWDSWRHRNTLCHTHTHTHTHTFVWIKIIHFSFMPKIIMILRSCSIKILRIFPTVNISKLNIWLVTCIAKNFIWTTLKMIFSIFRFFCTLRFQIYKYCPNHTSMEIWFIQFYVKQLTLMTGFVLH